MSNKKDGFVVSSGAIALFTVLTAVSGLLIDILLASRFGLGRLTDAFYAAYTIPFFIANMSFVLGQATLVPVFSRNAQAGRGASAYLSSYFNLAAVIGLPLSLAGVVFSRQVASLVAPGMEPAFSAVAGNLGRILFVVIFFSLLSEVLRSFLYANRSFVLASSTNFIRNATVACFLLFFHKDWGITSAAIGYAAGYLLQFGVLAGRVFIMDGVRYRPVIDKDTSGLRDGLRIGFIQGAGFGVLQTVTLAERIIGSYLPPGSITALSYASRITFMGAETLAGSMATATLPGLARAVGEKDHTRVRDVLGRSFRVSLLLFLPLTAMVVALHGPIITALYQRGAFTPEAVAVMSWVFMLYCLSFVFQGYNRLIHNYLFASLNPRGTLKLYTVLAAVTVLLDVALVGPLGISAMPLGYLAGSGAAFFLGRRFFVKDFQVLSGGEYRSFLVRTAFLSLLFGAACYIIFLLFKGVVPVETRWGLLMALIVSIVPAAALSVAFGFILKIKELDGLRPNILTKPKGLIE